MKRQVRHLILLLIITVVVARPQDSSTLNTFASNALNNEFANAVKKLIYNITLVTMSLSIFLTEYCRRRIDDPVTGATREEKGYLVTSSETGEEELVVMGAYSYMDDDGIETMTMYTSDKNGYRPRVSIKNRKYSGKSLKTFSG